MLLKIKSSQRLNPADSPGDFTITLSRPIEGRWTLRQAFICADFPNVNASNNRIPFLENATQKTAVIPIGYYSSSQIVSALQAALNLASGGWNTYTCTLNSVSQQVTITATSPFFLQWGTVPTNSAAGTFGFLAADTLPGLSVTAPSIVVPNSVLSFNIKVDELGSIIDAVGGLTTFDIPMMMNVDPRSFIVYEPVKFQQSVELRSPLKTLRIRVCDDNGRTLQLKQDWTMILESPNCTSL
jgi:hypothetical protein